MAEERTAEETLAAYKAAMGERRGAVYYALYCDLVWLNARWHEFRDLFASGAETIALLNRHGPFLFKAVQDTFWEYTLLTIARMTDPARTAGNENLSVNLLVELIDDPDLKTKANDALAICMEKAAFAREHRNKRIAHRDLGHALKEAPVPLGGVSRAHVEEMLKALEELMNLVQLHYMSSTSIYRLLGVNGAESLLIDLKRLESYKSEHEV